MRQASGSRCPSGLLYAWAFAASLWLFEGCSLCPSKSVRPLLHRARVTLARVGFSIDALYRAGGGLRAHTFYTVHIIAERDSPYVLIQYSCSMH